MDILNRVEELIETQRNCQRTDRKDKVLWRVKDGKFSTKFVSKKYISLVRQVYPVQEWWTGVWFSLASSHI